MSRFLPLILFLGKGSVAQARYKILKSFNIERESVLDVGCGPGQFSIPLSRRNFVVGLDILAKEVRKARERISFNCKLEFIVGDGRHLPFKERLFTRIICFEVIEHVDVSDAIIMLREIQRVIKDNGIVFLSTPRKDRSFFTACIGHMHEYSKSELYELLKSEFNDVKIKEYCGVVPTILGNIEDVLAPKLEVMTTP